MKINLRLLVAGSVVLTLLVLGLAYRGDKLGASPPLTTGNSNPPKPDEPQNASKLEVNRSKKVKIDWRPTDEEQKVNDATEAVFHGKVVDQHANPVPHAEIVIRANRNDPWVSSGRTRTMAADEHGVFFFREPNAPNIDVSITPPPAGYYPTEKSKGIFAMAEIPASMPEALRRRRVKTTKTTQETPHIFVLKKMASRDPLLVIPFVEGDLKEFQTHQVGGKPDQRVDIKYWLNPEVKRMVRGELPMHDWGIEITVVNGGLLEAKPPQSTISEDFIAPEHGYQPSLKFINDSSLPDEKVAWRYHTHFFVKFSDNTYARVEARFQAAIERPNSGPPRARLAIQSWYNPSGRRSLEYDHTMRIKSSAK